MGFEVKGAQGSFYVFLKVPQNMTDVDFTELATEYQLIIVPGRAFSRLDGYVRLSYGTDMETLKRGVSVLSEIMSRLQA